MTLQISNAPSEFRFKENVIDFNIFAEKFIEYMEDLEDIKMVKNEIKKDEIWFSYDSIRENYV